MYLKKLLNMFYSILIKQTKNFCSDNKKKLHERKQTWYRGGGLLMAAWQKGKILKYSNIQSKDILFSTMISKGHETQFMCLQVNHQIDLPIAPEVAMSNTLNDVTVVMILRLNFCNLFKTLVPTCVYPSGLYHYHIKQI